MNKIFLNNDNHYPSLKNLRNIRISFQVTANKSIDLNHIVESEISSIIPIEEYIFGPPGNNKRINNDFTSSSKELETMLRCAKCKT